MCLLVHACPGRLLCFRINIKVVVLRFLTATAALYYLQRLKLYIRIRGVLMRRMPLRPPVVFTDIILLRISLH